jgi:hypothetical protein
MNDDVIEKKIVKYLLPEVSNLYIAKKTYFGFFERTNSVTTGLNWNLYDQLRIENRLIVFIQPLELYQVGNRLYCIPETAGIYILKDGRKSGGTGKGYGMVYWNLTNDLQCIGLLKRLSKDKNIGQDIVKLRNQAKINFANDLLLGKKFMCYEV